MDFVTRADFLPNTDVERVEEDKVGVANIADVLTLTPTLFVPSQPFSFRDQIWHF